MSGSISKELKQQILGLIETVRAEMDPDPVGTATILAARIRRPVFTEIHLEKRVAQEVAARIDKIYSEHGAAALDVMEDSFIRVLGRSDAEYFVGPLLNTQVPWQRGMIDRAIEKAKQLETYYRQDTDKFPHMRDMVLQLSGRSMILALNEGDRARFEVDVKELGDRLEGRVWGWNDPSSRFFNGARSMYQEIFLAAARSPDQELGMEMLFNGGRQGKYNGVFPSWVHGRSGFLEDFIKSARTAGNTTIVEHLEALRQPSPQVEAPTLKERGLSRQWRPGGGGSGSGTAR